MDGKLTHLKLQIAEKLDEILAMFKPGRKISLFVRTPGEPEQDLMITDEKDDGEIVAMIHRSRKRKTI